MKRNGISFYRIERFCPSSRISRIDHSIHATPLNSRRVRAFTLTEALVVLVIIGILILLALPNLMPLITKAKATEAKIQLQHVYTLEKNYFYEKSKYSRDLTEISFEQQKLTTAGGQANYRIEIIDATNNSFKVRAMAVVDFDGMVISTSGKSTRTKTSLKPYPTDATPPRLHNGPDLTRDRLPGLSLAVSILGLVPAPGTCGHRG